VAFSSLSISFHEYDQLARLPLRNHHDRGFFSSLGDPQQAFLLQEACRERIALHEDGSCNTLLIIP
jgi:hypothetical protein